MSFINGRAYLDRGAVDDGRLVSGHGDDRDAEIHPQHVDVH